MTMKEFLKEIEVTYNNYFPASKIFLNVSNRYRNYDIYISCFLANNQSELSGKYWENDMFNIRFTIDTGTNETLTDASQIPDNLKLECYSKSYHIKPVGYMAFGSRRLTHRKTQGDAKKILKSLDRFFEKLYNSIKTDIEANLIHDSYKSLVSQKIN